MKKVTFEFNEEKFKSKAQLLKEMAAMSCKIQIEFDNRIIIVRNVKNNDIEAVIDVIDKYFNVSKASIEDDGEVEKILPVQNNSQALLNEEIRKLNNIAINGVLSELIKNISWAMNVKMAPEKDVAQFIWAMINEVSMKYDSNREPIKFAVGDIVNCNYGKHLNGEISGNRILTVICHISYAGYAFGVPMIETENVDKNDFRLEAQDLKESTCSKDFRGKKMLIAQGRYLNPLRFSYVGLQVKDIALEKILKEVAKIFNFCA